MARYMISLPLLMALVGCAFGTRHAQLTYPGDIQPAALTPAPTDDAVAVRYFADERDVRDRVGEVRNGLGMRTASVKAVGDPVKWVRDAMVHELAAAGYNVQPGDQDQATIVIDGQILRIYCTALASYEANVDLRVKAELGGDTLVDDIYHGTGGAGTNWAARGKSYARSLNEALSDAVRQFVSDLSAALRARGRAGKQ